MRITPEAVVVATVGWVVEGMMAMPADLTGLPRNRSPWDPAAGPNGIATAPAAMVAAPSGWTYRER